MSNEIMKSPIAEKYLPAGVDFQKLNRIDEVTNDFYQIVNANEKSPATAILRASAMQQLRALLTDEVMKPIMQLQGNKLGFITDKDRRKTPNGYVKGDGYPLEIVRDVTIWAAGHGARMVGNEINIIAGNGYLTREYFGRQLDELLGSEHWSIIPEVPRITRNPDGKTGALVTGKLFWRDSSGEHTETLQLAIKGDDFAGSDAYIGKFERKARKFIFERCTGRRCNDGDAGEIIDGFATEIDEEPPKKSPLETRRKRSTQKSSAATEPDPKPVEEPEIVSTPDTDPQPQGGTEVQDDEEKLAAELARRGEFITVETIRNFALDNGYEFDAKSAMDHLDDVLATVKANGGN